MTPTHRHHPRPAHRARAAVSALVVTVTVTTVALATGAAAAPAATRAPKQWADQVCAAIADWNTQLASSAPAAPGADPVGARAALSGSLGQAVIATDTVVRALKRAGTPDVARGSAIARDLRSAFSGAGRRLARATDAATALPTTDAAAFTRSASALEIELEGAITGIDAALAKMQRRAVSKALDRAFARSPACQAAAGTAAAPTR